MQKKSFYDNCGKIVFPSSSLVSVFDLISIITNEFQIAILPTNVVWRTQIRNVRTMRQGDTAEEGSLQSG